jgi:hypothetical protein
VNRGARWRGNHHSVAASRRWPAESLGISRQMGPEPFFASPAGALRPSGPSWRRRPPLTREDPLPVRRCASPLKTHLVLSCPLRGSSFKVVQRSPLHRYDPRCPLPASSDVSQFPREICVVPQSLRRQATQPRARSVPVVSHHPDGLLHRWLVGLLHPTTDPGVHRVSAGCRLPTGDAASPPMRYPPELIHLQSRIPVTRDRCPPAVADVRPRGASVDFKALLRASIRSARIPLPRRRTRSSPGLSRS